MEHGTVLFTAIFGFIGQYAKAHPLVPNWIPQTLMVACGLVWYWGNHGLPAPNFPAVVDWLEVALLSAASLPGAASLFSLIPGLQTHHK